MDIDRFKNTVQVITWRTLDKPNNSGLRKVRVLLVEVHLRDADAAERAREIMGEYPELWDRLGAL